MDAVTTVPAENAVPNVTNRDRCGWHVTGTDNGRLEVATKALNVLWGLAECENKNRDLGEQQ